MLMPAIPRSILVKAQKMPLPVKYTDMVKAIENVMTLEQGKFYHDKATALAAWAKVAGSPLAKKAATRLELHALARMGQLSEELRPTLLNNPRPGANSLLKAYGLDHNQITAARLLLKMPKKQFRETLQAAPSPNGLIIASRNSTASEGYQKITRAGNNLFNSLGFMRANPARELARSLTFDEAEILRFKIIEMQDWLDTLEQNLPEAPKGRATRTRQQIVADKKNGQRAAA
jgi:hypothetical protein